MSTDTPNVTKLDALFENADLHIEELSDNQYDRSQDERELSTMFNEIDRSDIANRRPFKWRWNEPDEGTTESFANSLGNDGCKYEMILLTDPGRKEALMIIDRYSPLPAEFLDKISECEFQRVRSVPDDPTTHDWDDENAPKPRPEKVTTAEPDD